MNDAMAPAPDEAGRAAIVAEWHRLAAEPPPFNPRPWGCATFLLAATLLLGMSMLAPAGVTLGAVLGPALAAILLTLLVGGFVVGFFFGSGVYARAQARAEAALAWLAEHPGAAEGNEWRSHAVSLLFNAVVSDGPTTLPTIDEATVRARLGDDMASLLAVERVLVEEVGMWRFLTTAD